MTLVRILAVCLAVSAAAGGLYYVVTARFDLPRTSSAIAPPNSPERKASLAPAPSNQADRFADRFYSLVDAAAPPDAATKPRAEVNVAADRAAVPPNRPTDPEGGTDTANKTKALTDEKPTAAAVAPFSALQIGDSHTSADYFSGEVRRVLQAKYGRGGVGYMPAGLPNGFHSSVLTITVSRGWTYDALLNRDANPAEFRFSGFNAVAAEAGANIKITPNDDDNDALEFDSIEIEATAQPGGGAIDVEVNGHLESHRDLEARVAEPVLIKIDAPRPTATLHEISITTGGKGTVSLSSISIYNEHTGLTYHNVGYSGATIDILNKLEPEQFADALRRINPRIVVLSFGTNEGANETLNLATYNDKYERVVGNIETALPDAVIVIIGPPDFNQISSACPKPQRKKAACRETPAALPSPAPPTGASPSAAASKPGSEPKCVWHTPAKLEQVREVQRKIADRHGFKYWNWALIMPAECGADKWFKESPSLMSADRVHFTGIGYRKSADEFIPVLIPIIDSIQAGNNVVSHH